MVDHLFVLPGDGGGEVLDWQASFSRYVEYREEEARERRQNEQLQLQLQQAEERALRDAAAPDAEASAAAPSAAPAAGKGAKPLSAFERQALARLEGEMEAVTERRGELQRRVDAFDPARNGYSELSEWTARLEGLAEELEETELKWLELEERAHL